jgi:PKD repeat protein
MSEFRFWKACGWMLLLVWAGHAHAAAPTATIAASPSEGRAPLGVFFDAGGSSADATTFLWEFGDGSISTAKSLTHVYVVAGTYIAKLTATNAVGENATSEVTITVTGTGEGPVTSGMSFRWSLLSANFTLKHSAITGDAMTITSAFNTVDLPGDLQGLAASFSVNDTFTVSGVLGPRGAFESADNRKPSFFVEVNALDQTLNVFISKADMKAALGLSGATNTTFPRPGVLVPIKFTFTIGSQTYTLTESFTYVSTAGASGRGQFNLKKNLGAINDGVFVVTKASAIENQQGNGHFYEFDALLSRPALKILQTPGPSGVFTFTFNDADPITIPADRVRQNGTKIVIDESDRDLGKIRHMIIDVDTRVMVVKTWDILANIKEGGTDLPLRGKPFTAFNFAVRLDFDQGDGTKFQAVTATRLTRRTTDDAFWQTGRRGKRQ